jgi:NAD(P)-dependent dehydrogenase (short-subunit alcohol dehydrogenase family)
MIMEENGGTRVALVTRASYGVGAATALALARDGLDLVLTATREENLAKTCEVLAPFGRQVLPSEFDLRAQASIEALVAKALDRFGRIDVLVNNAGANLRRKAVDITREDWNELMAINVTGTFFLTQQIGRHLLARQTPGRIITVVSTAALVGQTERAVYGISKAALIQMTRMLAIEWAEHGIAVNAVAPGRLNTESPSRAGTGSNKAYMDAMLKRIPMHRLATVEEVAGAISFLAGPAGGTITGQVIVVDGGLTAA